jgi:hypothetical protein
VIVVFAIALMILGGVISYVFFRGLSGRKRHASSDTFITFNNNHLKSDLFMFTDDNSSPSAVPGYTGFYPRNSLINSESKSFTSIKISPSRPAVFGHEIDSEGFIRVVLTPPTPAKRKRRESLIDYESEEDLPAYS